MSSTSTKRRAAQRKRRRPSGPKKTKRAPKRTRRSGGVPGWGDLSRKKKQSAGRRAMRQGAVFLENVSTVRFALVVALVAALSTAYVAHVHATQDLYVALQQERAENQRLHLKHERLRSEFDRATGPAVVYERAPQLGLEEDVAYGPTITIDEE